MFLGGYMKKNSKKFNYFGSIGIVLYVVISLIDRVIYKISDPVYIVLMLVAIGFVFTGIIIDRKGK